MLVANSIYIYYLQPANQRVRELVSPGLKLFFDSFVNVRPLLARSFQDAITLLNL